MAESQQGRQQQEDQHEQQEQKPTDTSGVPEQEPNYVAALPGAADNAPEDTREGQQQTG